MALSVFCLQDIKVIDETYDMVLIVGVKKNIYHYILCLFGES